MSYPEPKFCGRTSKGEIHGYYDTKKTLRCPKCTENRIKERIYDAVEEALVSEAQDEGRAEK